MHPFSQPTETGRRDIQSRYILMPVSMLVKCEKCGYENFPQHRFCGMCAAELRLPGPAGTQPGPAPSRPVAAPTVAPPRVGVAAPKAREVVPQPVSGPSFLGLANEPAENRNVSYLLEDEPGPSHTGRNLVLLIVLAGAIAAGWHWRENLVSLVSKFSGNAAGNTQANSSAPAGSDSPSPTTPATGANASTPVGNQGAVADTQTPAAQGQTPRRLLRRQAPRIQPSLPKRISPSHLNPKLVTLRARRRTMSPTRLPASLRHQPSRRRYELRRRPRRSRAQTNWRQRAKNIFTETVCRKTALGLGQV